jgi:hypothetical protein
LLKKLIKKEVKLFSTNKRKADEFMDLVGDNKKGIEKKIPKIKKEK